MKNNKKHREHQNNSTEPEKKKVVWNADKKTQSELSHWT